MTAHLFFECEWFVSLWNLVPFSVVLPPERWNFANWFRFLRMKLDGDGCTLAGVVYWCV